MASLSKALPSAQRKYAAGVRATSVAEAKANFSAVIRSVEEGRAEVIVERRGVAVAKIIPFSGTALPSGYGWMRGTVEELGDIVGPTGEDWDAQTK